ncbi:MAG: AraC family transcriptional regulator [Bacteroidales bacterium]|nr:AraC family transcriptional regulator [Bacteroidales bacterium]
MGTLFLAFPTPKDLKLQNYRISLRILAAAYFVMTVLNIIIMFLDFEVQTPEYFNFIVLLISSLQALLFTFTLIILLNPAFVSSKRLLLFVSPTLLFSLIYFILLIVVGDCKITGIRDFYPCFSNPTVIIRLLFFLYYISQLVYYILLFLKQEKIYLNKINNNYSDVSKFRLNWIRWAFFLALSIGIIAVGIQIFPGKLSDLVFNIILTLFYFGFALKYINYNKIFSYLAPVLGTIKSSPEKQFMLKPRIIWGELKKLILSEKYFLIEGITLEQMSHLLKIGRTSLSNLINSEEGVSFNLWINQLRIKEAKSLLSQNPDYNLTTIAELTGYSEQSNFSRQFKNLTGESPSVWRKKKIAS